MDVTTIQVDRDRARDLFRKYKTHSHYSAPIDREIQRAYQLIAQGRMVIRALESVKVAGLNEQGLPKLAICRADAESCWLSCEANGAAVFDSQNQWRGFRQAPRCRAIQFPSGSFAFPAAVNRGRHQAILPLIPVHLRPKRGLANYHVLWEAEWTKTIPVDPMLLRRIGRSDLWLVLAAWDLTEVERAALQQRVSA